MPLVARLKMAFSCGHSGQAAVDNHLLAVDEKRYRLPAGATKRTNGRTNNGTSSLSMSVPSIIEHINDVYECEG